MEERHWTDRLSDYLDGGLLPAERTSLEAHLRTCTECAHVLDELRAVVTRARGLRDTSPRKDPWRGIERAIASLPQEDGRVFDFSARLESIDPLEDDGRLHLSMSQVVAASLILIVGSAAASWALVPRAGGGTVGEDTGIAALVRTSLPAGVGNGYSEELARLETLISAHREELDPNTVRILEKNLAIIDRAIAESGQALAADPGNEYLKEHLDMAVRRKVDYLREASLISGWTG